MTCPICNSDCRRFGKHRNGLWRFHCAQCKKTYTESHERPLDKMTVPFEKAVMALQLLLEGNSVRSTERVTGLHRDTILRTMALAGERCEKVMGRLIVNVPVKDVKSGRT